MNDDAGLIRAERQGSVLRLCIDRPDRHNPLSRPVLAVLAAKLREATQDEQLSCVVLRGAGDRYFAAGGDLKDLDSVRERAATEEMATSSRAVLDCARECAVPVVALLNGDALGGGAELAVACDLRVMAAHAHIAFIHSKLALSTGWGGGPDLFDLIGPTRALAMLCRAEAVDAPTALNWGLADAVAVPGQAVEEVLESFIAPLRTLPPALARAYKAQALAARRGESREARRARELALYVPSWLSDEHWAAAERIMSRRRER